MLICSYHCSHLLLVNLVNLFVTGIKNKECCRDITNVPLNCLVLLVLLSNVFCADSRVTWKGPTSTDGGSPIKSGRHGEVPREEIYREVPREKYIL
jgi:hypothetical protein